MHISGQIKLTFEPELRFTKFKSLKWSEFSCGGHGGLKTLLLGNCLLRPPVARSDGFFRPGVIHQKVCHFAEKLPTNSDFAGKLLKKHGF